MSYDLLDRVYSIMIDVMTGVSAGSGNAVFYNTDNHTSFIEVSITNGIQSFNMSEYNYQLVISKPDKTMYSNSYTTEDNNKLVIALDSDMLSGIGNNIAQLYVMKTVNDANKVVTMIEFNYTVKAGNYSALAPESVNHDSIYIALRTDVDSILSKIESGELGTGLTATQAEQLATAYNHSQSPHITTANVNNAVSTYVTAHKAELKGDKGEKGETGADGVAGAKGDKGDRGEKGADGVTPTFTIGTITTGAAGSTATVTITGTAPNYVLNFTIPKGDKGDKGDTGASGSGGSGGIAFEDTYVSDANLWLTNGYTKTSGTSTINLPSVCTNTKDKWGILFFIAENATNGTGTQMFFPIDGAYKGKIFTRSIVNRTNISSWIMLASKDDIIEAVNGTNGATFTPAVDDAGNLSWSNDKDLANPNTVNIKGAKGDKGDKGDTGAKGADGQTPNISIGTVTTGAAGTNASATISGTTPNLTLNLTIPKGDKGDKGDTGVAGSGGTVTKTVKVLTSSAKVTLTTDEYQYLEGNRDMSLTLPTVSTSTDVTILHLFYVPNAARTLTFSDSTIHWQNSTPTIEANKYYEFIFTRTHKGAWLAGVVVYG